MVATCFALTSFAAAVLVGVYAGNDAATVILRAILVMLGCYFVGLIVGAIASRAIEDHITRYKREHPIPQNVQDLQAMQDATPPNSGVPT